MSCSLHLPFPAQALKTHRNSKRNRVRLLHTHCSQNADKTSFLLMLLDGSCHALVTSSLLKGVGVGSFSSTSVAASAAAIRWVSKDGIGALGRLFIGGRFGDLFDDDPKQWHMYADFIGSAGSIFDLATQVYPAYFLPLASVGNLTKAVARGLKDPSSRVIQNHFAISGNLGEVAAKVVAIASSTHASPIEHYWRSMLPHTPLPPYLQRQIQLGANSSHPYVYRPDVNVAYLFPYKYVKGVKKITDKYDISNTTIFFLHKDMVRGTKMWPRYYKSILDHGFLPRKMADSIPFSTDKLPEILEHFSVKPESAEAMMIKGTLAECEAPSMKGETKGCATSLESLIDFNIAKFRGSNDFRVTPTDVPEDCKKQEYTIASNPKLIGDDAVVSHKLTYPYALFYSHWISDTKVYWVPMVGADGSKVKLVSVCHMDTTYWYDGHIAFKVLKVKPGVPICHFPGSDALIWVHKNET